MRFWVFVAVLAVYLSVSPAFADSEKTTQSYRRANDLIGMLKYDMLRDSTIEKILMIYPPPVKELIAALDCEDDIIIKNVLITLGKLENIDEEYVPEIILLFRRGELEPLSIAVILANIGIAAVPYLIESIKNPVGIDPEILVITIELISYRHDGLEAFLPEISLLLESSDTRVRNYAARILGSLGVDARSASAKVIETFSIEGENLPREAAITLAKTGFSDDVDVKHAITLFENEDERFEICAASALARTPGYKEEGIKLLLNILEDSGHHDQTWAINLLKEFGPRQDIVDALSGLLAGDSAYLRVEAAQALFELGVVTDEVKNTFIYLSTSDKVEPYVRTDAFGALAMMEPENQIYVNELISLTYSEDFFERDNSVASLGRLGKLALPALPRLKWMSKYDQFHFVGRDFNIRATASNAIERIESELLE